MLFENNILQRVLNHKDIKNNIHTPMFDGFTINKYHNIDIVIELCNKITKDEKLFWAIKEHDNSIICDENIDIDFKITGRYEEVKEEFEKTYWIIENPFMFVKQYELDYPTKQIKHQFYNKEKFRDLVKPIVFLMVKKMLSFSLLGYVI